MKSNDLPLIWTRDNKIGKKKWNSNLFLDCYFWYFQVLELRLEQDHYFHPNVTPNSKGQYRQQFKICANLWPNFGKCQLKSKMTWTKMVKIRLQITFFRNKIFIFHEMTKWNDFKIYVIFYHAKSMQFLSFSIFCHILTYLLIFPPKQILVVYVNHRQEPNQCLILAAEFIVNKRGKWETEIGHSFQYLIIKSAGCMGYWSGSWLWCEHWAFIRKQI